MDKFRSAEVILLVQVNLGVVEMLPNHKLHEFKLIGSQEEVERLAEQYDAGALLHAESWLNPSYLRVCGLLAQEADPEPRQHYPE